MAVKAKVQPFDNAMDPLARIECHAPRNGLGVPTEGDVHQALGENSLLDSRDEATSQAQKNIRSQMPVGTLVLHAGLCWSSLDDYGKFIRIVDKDQYRASEAIQMAFIQACEEAGIPFQESIGP